MESGNENTLYKFETDQFGLSETGFHLLRSRYNYKTIEYSEISQITIEKGRQVSNWFIVLILGIVLFCIGTFAIVKIIYEYFFADNYHLFYLQQFVVPILPLALGIFSIYQSLRIGPVIKIVVNNKTEKYPIAELQKKSQMEDLTDFLNTHPLTKNIVTINYRHSSFK